MINVNDLFQKMRLSIFFFFLREKASVISSHGVVLVSIRIFTFFSSKYILIIIVTSCLFEINPNQHDSQGLENQLFLFMIKDTRITHRLFEPSKVHTYNNTTWYHCVVFVMWGSQFFTHSIMDSCHSV